MIVRFEDEARQEWHEAVLVYEEARQGLGVEFVTAVRDAVQLISDSPSRWPAYTTNTHAYRLSRFPYRIVYTIERTEIVIVTVMHTKRDDQFWRRRFGNDKGP